MAKIEQKQVNLSGAAAPVPTRIAVGIAFFAPPDTQILYSDEIDIEGEFEIDGVLSEVP